MNTDEIFAKALLVHGREKLLLVRKNGESFGIDWKHEYYRVHYIEMRREGDGNNFDTFKRERIAKRNVYVYVFVQE